GDEPHQHLVVTEIGRLRRRHVVPLEPGRSRLSELPHRVHPFPLPVPASRSGPIWSIRRTPHNAIAIANSRCSRSSTPRTPAAPAVVRPHNTGRPTSTASAPSAIALSTSVPRRTPPSISTGTA